MKMQKYIDMAYGNPRGLEWLNIMHEEFLWTKWCNKVISNTQANWILDSDRPTKILMAAIWHFGFAHDTPMSEELRKTARRLRKGDDPPERGAGASFTGIAPCVRDLSIHKIPLEFYLLDNFLEHEVRPKMDSSTKES